MKLPQITIVTPSLPTRTFALVRALRSASRQTLPPAALSVAIDLEGQGGAPTRQRALEAAQTEWVAFLDDDDSLKPDHLETLYTHAVDTGADMVYSWFDMIGGIDPFPPTHQTREFDPENPIETTITTLCRREAAMEVGFKPLDRGHNTNSGEDYGFVLGLVAIGAQIRNVNAGRTLANCARTWLYIVHEGNTSGLPSKGDAAMWARVRDGRGDG